MAERFEDGSVLASPTSERPTHDTRVGLPVDGRPASWTGQRVLA